MLLIVKYCSVFNIGIISLMDLSTLFLFHLRNNWQLIVAQNHLHLHASGSEVTTEQVQAPLLASPHPVVCWHWLFSLRCMNWIAEMKLLEQKVEPHSIRRSSFPKLLEKRTYTHLSTWIMDNFTPPCSRFLVKIQCKSFGALQLYSLSSTVFKIVVTVQDQRQCCPRKYLISFSLTLLDFPLPHDLFSLNVREKKKAGIAYYFVFLCIF